jgi:hypothetical protein
MAVGTTAELADMIAQDPDCDLAAADHDFYYAPEISTWETRPSLVGSGQCVALNQAACGAPHTAHWRKGPKVRGNDGLVVGTAIAAFDHRGRYPNHAAGNHAELFVALSDDGIVVVDQWAHKRPPRPSRRIIEFRNGVGTASDDGDRFWVVVAPRG